MKKITLLFCGLLACALNAQTIAWSSDSEDLTDWGVLDNDGDGNNWGVFTGAEPMGFAIGNVFGSRSWDPVPAPNGTPLTPDNVLFTPTFAIPGNAMSITFKMKVGSSDSGFFLENFAVYIYDNAVGSSFDNLIHEETLTEGGSATAKDITATIPASFSGKTLGILIRHYNTTDQNLLLVDDFEVSYNTTLSIKEKELNLISVYPNPVKDIINIDANLSIDIITIVNQLGQQVIQFKAKNINNNKIDLSVLSNGLYFMNISSEGKTKSFKIIKE